MSARSTRWRCSAKGWRPCSRGGQGMPVNIVEVPKGADGADQGIDDYLAGGGLLDDLKVRAFEEGWMPPRTGPSCPRRPSTAPPAKWLRTSGPTRKRT